MLEDARGLPLSAANDEAVRNLDGVIDAYLRFGKDTGPRLKQTFAADPDMLMAHCLKGYFFLLFSVPVLVDKAGGALETARRSAEQGGASQRERRHLEALAAWVRGDMRGAVGHWEAILLDHPRDILALKLAHFVHFYLGDAAQLRDSVARVMYAWDETSGEYGYVLGMRAFGLEESGDYEGAERAGRAAVEISPADAWAVHAVAHVMEMQDRQHEGIAWLREHEPHWSGGNNFVYHLWWHLALFHLEQESFDEVLSLYDTRVRSDQSDEYLDICNATSLLWRLEERGVDVGDRWNELADRCEARINEHLLMFPDVHFAMALAAGGREPALREMQASLQAMVGDPDVTQSMVAGAVGLPLCEAVEAWFAGDYGAVVERIEPLRYALPVLGGSHAQRDLFHQMLIASTARAGRPELGRALLCERTALRPGNPWSWKRYADALDAVEDEEGAMQARDEAARLLAI